MHPQPRNRRLPSALCIALGALAAGTHAHAQTPMFTQAPTAMDPLQAAEVAFGRVDFDGTRTAARAALEGGGHSSQEIARLWYLLGVSNAALRDTTAARDAFIRLMALTPGQDIEASLSPPLRPAYQEARAFWTAQPQGFAVTVERGERGLRVAVHDPSHMARAVVARVRAGAASPFTPVRVAVAPLVEIPVPDADHAMAIDYALRVVDEWGNRVVELGTEAAPRSVVGREFAGAGGDTAGRARWRWWGVAGLIAGGVGLVGGGVADAIREGHAATWNSDDCLRNGRTRADNCSAERDAANGAQTGAIAGFVVGGALAVTGAVVLGLSMTGDGETPARTAWRCGAGPGWVGVSCGRSF